MGSITRRIRKRTANTAPKKYALRPRETLVAAIEYVFNKKIAEMEADVGGYKLTFADGAVGNLSYDYVAKLSQELP